MIEPGVYNTVDPGGLEKLQRQHEQEIDQNKSKAKIWIKHKEEYKTLKTKLSTITDKTQYNVMVPFGGKKAFFEGQLVHTNEIMVLLGENWFVERSAKDASDICQRRLDRCDKMLEDLEKEVKMYKSWQREAEQLGQDENLLEIREPYNEEEENKWREKHRDRVKQEKQQSLSKQAAKANIKNSSNDNDDNFWQRLDELELEEELDAHLEAQEGLESNEDFRFRSGSEEKTRENDGVEEEEDEDAETEEDDDWSVSPPLSDVEEEDEEETEVEEVAEKVRRLNKEMDRNKTQVGSGGMGPKRSVSFGDVSERLFSREQDNGLLKPVLTSSANTETTSTNFEAVTPTALNTPVSAVIVPDTKVIEFQPSRVLNFSCENVIGDFDSKNTLKPSTPGDLVRLYGSAKQTATPVSNQRKKNPRPKKSILKAGSKYGPPLPIKTEQVAPADPQLVEPTPRLVKPKFQAVSAVKDRVVERERGDSASGEATKKPVTQVLSRFRATRVHQ